MGRTVERTIDLRKSIKARLLTKCTSVFYGRAKGSQSGSYVVFRLTTGTYEELCIQYELEVYVVGFGDDTQTIETLADDIWDLFDHYAYCSGALAYSVYPSVRNDMTEEDKSIITRRLTFTVKQFIGG